MEVLYKMQPVFRGPGFQTVSLNYKTFLCFNTQIAEELRYVSSTPSAATHQMAIAQQKGVLSVLLVQPIPYPRPFLVPKLDNPIYSSSSSTNDSQVKG